MPTQMDLSSVTGWLAAHRTLLLAAGAGALSAGALAMLLQRSAANAQPENIASSRQDAAAARAGVPPPADAAYAAAVPGCILLDHGSLRAQSTLQLRVVAALLQAHLRDAAVVLAASARFSERVPAAALAGQPAHTLATAARQLAAAGHRRIVVLPLFLGPGSTVTKVIPKQLGELQRELPDVHFQLGSYLGRGVAPEADALVVEAPLLRQDGDGTRTPGSEGSADSAFTMVGLEDEADTSGADSQPLARALAARVRETIAAQQLAPPVPVVLCDHGSPTPAVGVLRNELAKQLATELGGLAARVQPASMERREGTAFDFCEPLLERVFDNSGLPTSGDVVVALAFLLPGAHAGEGGDIAQILDGVCARHPQLRPHTTALLADHPLIVEHLAQQVLRLGLGRGAAAGSKPSRSASAAGSLRRVDVV